METLSFVSKLIVDKGNQMIIMTDETHGNSFNSPNMEARDTGWNRYHTNVQF
ncbi:Uncharacterised protein [Legionella quateirensis]|uniref:Uncharacterized protein n=1 Tax=Legionella quateirensis TaxID=45072 RepID=A0A378L046_9GAMM|nr:hypothetical protein Lqua_0625 [Legionella quateirensis]STY19211.1 Uncharacterised protein [Legionella quateirensis]